MRLKITLAIVSILLITVTASKLASRELPKSAEERQIASQEAGTLDPRLDPNDCERGIDEANQEVCDVFPYNQDSQAK